MGRQGLSIARLEAVDLFNDLDGLAALCCACDLVITVSNVTAHIAGALGRPVWLLAPAANGRIWYWFQGRADSPWYPSMRVFTQPSPHGWLDVLERIERALDALPRGAKNA
jgi:ADP-heptose:LPS heptosyltransferase